jgi:hypothetical protein
MYYESQGVLRVVIGAIDRRRPVVLSARREGCDGEVVSLLTERVAEAWEYLVP